MVSTEPTFEKVFIYFFRSFLVNDFFSSDVEDGLCSGKMAVSWFVSAYLLSSNTLSSSISKALFLLLSGLSL